MILRELLRNDFKDYIRNRIVKDKCEICGCTEKLHLHHIDKFHNLLMETLDELKLQELDTDDYDEFELQSIRNFMLAKQIKCDYSTLCESCHMKLHSKEVYSKEYKEHYYNPFGGYILVNYEKLNELDISHNLLFRLIYLGVNTNYDGYIVDKTKNRNNKYNSTNLNELLQLSRSEYFNTLKKLEELYLIIKDDNGIIVNKKFIARGFTNYKHYAKIFNDNFISFYNNTKISEHNYYGKVFMIFMISNHGKIDDLPKEVEKYCDKTHISRFIKNANKNMILFKKISVKEYIINPTLWYDGMLSNEFKNALESF